MTYISGTLTDSNAPATLYGSIATALSAAGYTLVKTVVIGARTHKVWKSAAANNSAGLDWYLDVAYTTVGAGSIWFTPFEYFDPATDLGYRGPYQGANSTIETTYHSRFGAVGYALETNWAYAAGTGVALYAPATSFGYWISVTGDRVISISSAAPYTFNYAGLYDMDTLHAAKAGVKAFPLITVASNTSAGQSLLYAITRLPPATVLAANGWSAVLSNSGPTLSSGMFPSLPTGVTDAYPAAGTRWTLAGTTSGKSGRWGFLKDVLIITTDVTVSRGDTVTVGGVTHILTTSLSGYSFAMKAA